MDDLGSTLKRARETRGVSLQEIAGRTKISVGALEALERNDFSRLPGGIFGRAFVREYAKEIGLDPDTTVDEFVVHLDRSEREAAERGATKVEITAEDRRFLERQRRAVGFARVALALLAIGAIAGLGWGIRAWRARPAPPASVALPHTPASEPAKAATDVLAPEPPVPAAAADTAGPGVGLLIEIEVTGDCWIVATVDGAAAVSQLFHAGDRRRFEASRDVSLDVGNAGVVRLTINGKSARPIGAAGAHVTVRVTPDTVAKFL